MSASCCISQKRNGKKEKSFSSLKRRRNKEPFFLDLNVLAWVQFRWLTFDPTFKISVHFYSLLIVPPSYYFWVRASGQANRVAHYFNAWQWQNKNLHLGLDSDPMKKVNSPEYEVTIYNTSTETIKLTSYREKKEKGYWKLQIWSRFQAQLHIMKQIRNLDADFLDGRKTWRLKVSFDALAAAAARAL